MSKQIVARCQKCGREFIWLNPASDLIDHYYPANERLRYCDIPTTAECGGEIKLTRPQPEPVS